MWVACISYIWNLFIVSIDYRENWKLNVHILLLVYSNLDPKSRITSRWQARIIRLNETWNVKEIWSKSSDQDTVPVVMIYSSHVHTPFCIFKIHVYKTSKFLIIRKTNSEMIFLCSQFFCDSVLHFQQKHAFMYMYYGIIHFSENPEIQITLWILQH